MMPMHEPIPIRQLEALKALSDHGSITRAAVALGVSQPAVSRLLGDLAASLGFSLYYRHGGCLHLTQEARVLIPEIRRVVEGMQYISAVGRNLPKQKAGHLRIACLPGFATSHLPHVVSTFISKRPDITVTIEPDRPERIVKWVIGEQYDCGITDSFEGHPAIEGRTLDIRSVCIFPTGHWLSRLDVITPRDLGDEKLIHDRPDSPYYRSLANAFSAAGVEIDPVVVTRQFTCACELVCRGVGVSIVSVLDAETYIGKGVSYRPFEPDIPHKLSLVRPNHQRPSLLTMEFLSMFEESLSSFQR